MLLVRAAHPRQAVLTALAMAVAAAVSGPPAARGRTGPRHGAGRAGGARLGQRPRRPEGRPGGRAHRQAARHRALERGTVGFALACAAAAPGAALALQRDHRRPAPTCSRRWSACPATGGCATALLSWLPWAVSFALYPAYLSYGGWGGGAQGGPPTVAMTAGRRRARRRRPRPDLAARPGRRQQDRPAAPAAAARAAGRCPSAAGAAIVVLRGRCRASRGSSGAPSGCLSDPGRAPASLSPVNLRRTLATASAGLALVCRPRRLRIQLSDRPRQPDHRRGQRPRRHGRRAERRDREQVRRPRHLHRDVRQHQPDRSTISVTSMAGDGTAVGQITVEPLPIDPKSLVNLATERRHHGRGHLPTGPVRHPVDRVRQRRDGHAGGAGRPRRRPVARPRHRHAVADRVPVRDVDPPRRRPSPSDTSSPSASSS